MWCQQSTGVQRDSLAQRAWYQGYQHIESVVPRLNMWCQQSTGVQRDSLAQRAWYQGYRGVPTHRVSGTKDSTCGTSRVLGCTETHWHREHGTRGTKGYQHIESVVPKTQHVVPAEYWGAERLTGTESLVPRVPSGTNT